MPRTVPLVPATWLAWPTLMSGSELVKTAGVYYRQEELHRVLGTYGPLVMAREWRSSAGCCAQMKVGTCSWTTSWLGA
jgi:hypothetical protein